jgi:diguanylate cyclase (GGDEF)-like protein
MPKKNKPGKTTALYSESGISYDEAHSDKLTGCRLYNQFDSEFESMIMAADNDLGDISLVMFDLDDFKGINDNYGHKTGDSVLITVAGFCKPFHDDGHYVYRYGGDCFAILMLGVEKEEAFLQIERMRADMTGQLWVAPGITEPFQISISIGVATYREDGTNIVELMRKVNGALYRAKSTGCNKVCLAREEKMVTKTSHYTTEQLQRLSDVAKYRQLGEAILLREALDDLLKKYDDKKKSPNGKTVLIVDDAPFMRSILRDILTREGYAVVAEATNGASGMEKFNDILPDVVLLDIIMPEMDGMEFLRKVKKNENSRIVMVSAKCHASAVLESIQLGADFFIAKPFQSDYLLSSLAQVTDKPFFNAVDLEKYRDYCNKEGLLSSDTERMSQEQIWTLTTL